MPRLKLQVLNLRARPSPPNKPRRRGARLRTLAHCPSCLSRPSCPSAHSRRHPTCATPCPTGGCVATFKLRNLQASNAADHRHVPTLRRIYPGRGCGMGGAADRGAGVMSKAYRPPRISCIFFKMGSSSKARPPRPSDLPDRSFHRSR